MLEPTISPPSPAVLPGLASVLRKSLLNMRSRDEAMTALSKGALDLPGGGQISLVNDNLRRNGETIYISGTIDLAAIENFCTGQNGFFNLRNLSSCFPNQAVSGRLAIAFVERDEAYQPYPLIPLLTPANAARAAFAAQFISIIHNKYQSSGIIGLMTGRTTQVCIHNRFGVMDDNFDNYARGFISATTEVSTGSST